MGKREARGGRAEAILIPCRDEIGVIGVEDVYARQSEFYSSRESGVN